MEEKLEVCDFCGKSQREVEKIIKGDNACICSECVSLCCEILDDYGIDYHQSEKVMNCSFCGKSKEEVVKLIAGPDCYICDECVQKYAGATLLSSDKVGTCSFCGKTHEEVKIIAQNGSCRICNECMDLCKEILLEEDSPVVSGAYKCSNCCKEIVDTDKAMSIAGVTLCKDCIETLYAMTHKKLNWWGILFAAIVVLGVMARVFKIYGYLGTN